jgi:fluoride exporter
MKLLLWAMIGGALGSGARHVINVGFGRWLGSGFPWSTLCVNVVGCLLMGVVVEVLALRFKGSLDLRSFIATGILGGFTTFSAYALDFATLVGQQDRFLAGLYLVGSVALSMLALYSGLWLTRWLFT